MADDAPASQQRHRRRLKLQALLLGCWFALSFGALFFARDLQFRIAGWPFHYWFAAQGGVLAFVAILAIYAAVMRRLEPEEEIVDWPPEPDDG